MARKHPEQGDYREKPAVVLNESRKISLTLGFDALLLLRRDGEARNGEQKIPYSAIKGEPHVTPEKRDQVTAIDPSLGPTLTLVIKADTKEYQIAVSNALGWMNEIRGRMKK